MWIILFYVYCFYLLLTKIDALWYSDKFFVNDSVKKNDCVLVQWQIDGKWFSEKLIKSLY